MNPILELHPRLVEEAVFEAVRGEPEEGAFLRMREPIYRETDPDDRESAFTRLNARCFEELDLGAPIRQTLTEHDSSLRAVSRIALVPALSPRDEGAEMFVTSSGERSVVVAVRPALLADPVRAMIFLRRELMHVVDMLDPTFEYEPHLPPHPLGPAHGRLVQDRYRALWSTSIDGRLAALGRIDRDAARNQRRSEFGRPFACLGESFDGCFDRVFDGARPSHRRFVAIALDPVSGFALEESGAPDTPRDPARSRISRSGEASRASAPSASAATLRRGRCPLCGFPIFELAPEPRLLPEAVLSEISVEFPEWRSADGLCRQCADLYAARISIQSRCV